MESMDGNAASSVLNNGCGCGCRRGSGCCDCGYYSHHDAYCGCCSVKFFSLPLEIKPVAALMWPVAALMRPVATPMRLHCGQFT